MNTTEVRATRHADITPSGSGVINVLDTIGDPQNFHSLFILGNDDQIHLDIQDSSGNWETYGPIKSGTADPGMIPFAIRRDSTASSHPTAVIVRYTEAVRPIDYT